MSTSSPANGVETASSVNVGTNATSSDCPAVTSTTSSKDSAVSPEVATEPQPMSDRDFRAFNTLAETMNYYHNHFRSAWNSIYTSVGGTTTSCPTSTSAVLSARGLLYTTRQLISHLTMHHQIEEAHIFPLLAVRMPFFREDSGSHTAYTQHAAIHAGLDELDKYIKEVESGQRELRREEVKGIMDGFGEVLWCHLDEEVRELGAKNMFAAGWTRSEMREFPM